jgi:hypothetical protein
MQTKILDNIKKSVPKGNGKAAPGNRSVYWGPLCSLRLSRLFPFGSLQADAFTAATRSRNRDFSLDILGLLVYIAATEAGLGAISSSSYSFSCIPRI